MSALPTWAHWSIFAAAVLLSPVLPLLMAGVFMNLVAVLKYAGPPAFRARVPDPCCASKKRGGIPVGEGAQLATVREAYLLRLVDFGRPVGRYTDPRTARSVAPRNAVIM
jgi:hypothetical protein